MKALNKLNILLCTLLFVFTSCSNLFENIPESNSSDSNTYIMIVPEGISINTRSIDPNIDAELEKMNNISLYGTKIADPDGTTVSGTRRKLPGTNITIGNIATLYNQLMLLEDGPGTYKFEFTGSIESIYFHQEKTEVIVESETNIISFNLTPRKASNDLTTDFGDFGGMDIKLNFGDYKSFVGKIIVTLNDLSKSETDEGYVADTRTFTSFGQYVEYKRSPSDSSSSGSVSNSGVFTGRQIAVGDYRITFDFYSSDITTTTQSGSSTANTTSKHPLNSLSYIVRVARGLYSTLEQTIDLNELYTITYNFNLPLGVSTKMANGDYRINKYSRKSEDIILPFLYRGNALFAGWQDEEGQLLTKIKTGSTGNKTLTAQWITLSSGDTGTIYVDSDTTKTIHFGTSLEHPLTNLSSAIDLIDQANGNSHHNWIIKIKGSITDHVNVTGVNYLNSYVDSITLEGYTGLDGTLIPQDELYGDFSSETEDGAVLSLNTKVPFIIKNLKITGGNNTNTGDIKGGAIYLGSYGTGSNKVGAKVTLDDGALITGNTAEKGSGVYVSSGATLQMGGSAQVAANNDVYLSSGTKIEITNQFEGSVQHAATVTPEVYSVENQVLAMAPNGSGALENECSVFKVTPQVEGDVTTNWEIDTDGKLQKASNGGNSNPEDLVYLSGTNGEELPSNTYWDGEGTNTVGNLYVSKTEITQAEYEKYMTYENGYNPTETGDNKLTYPAYYVSWCEAVIYCNLRSMAEGITPYYSIDGETDPRKWTAAGVATIDGKCYLPVANITISNYDTPGNNGMWEPTYVNAGGHLKFAEESTDEGHYGYRLPCGAEWCYIAANSSSLEITDLTTKNVDEWVQAWDEMGSSVGHYHVSGSINGTYNEDYDFSTYVDGDAVPNYAHEGTVNIGFRVVRNAE